MKPADYAFPRAGEYQQGITIRDYFAAVAMQGLTARFDYAYETAARQAYRYADEMMKAREAK